MSEVEEIKSGGSIVIVRVRGITGVKKGISETMKMLKLFRKNYCAVVPDNDDYRGICKKINDFVTWGEIDSETLKILKEKRLKKGKDKNGETFDKKFFALNPPVKGFGRKGIKKSFSQGGALGYRGSKINELLKRML